MRPLSFAAARQLPLISILPIDTSLSTIVVVGLESPLDDSDILGASTDIDGDDDEPVTMNILAHAVPLLVCGSFSVITRALAWLSITCNMVLAIPCMVANVTSDSMIAIAMVMITPR